MSAQANGDVGVGIDFGTTNSVAALYDGKQVLIVDVGGGRRSLPSANYLDRSCLAVTGQEALDAYIGDNIGRRVELASVPLGTARTSTGSYDEEGLPQLAGTNLIFSQAMFDVNLPGRLFYGSKQLLASREDAVFQVFDKQYRLEAIITPILLRLRQALAGGLQELGLSGSLEHAVLGRPVHFERSGQGGDERAVRRLETAFANAGFRDRRFCYEPVAAALNYLHGLPDDRRREAGTLLTVDFGGGTLDFSLLRRHGEGFSVVGTHGIALGGNHIDQLLFRKLLFPLLGQGRSGRVFTADGYVEARFAFETYAELLLNWPVSYLLNQNRYLTPIHDMIQGGGDNARCFQRLMDLIQLNYSYLVLEHLKAFKERFAGEERVTLDIPELDLTLSLERDEFNAVIAPATAQFEQALDEALRLGGIDEAGVDTVICVGGSTRLPAIRAALQRRFPERVEEHDIFTSVASGLAIRDYHRSTQGRDLLSEAG